jgi:hypothetical protein
MHWLSFRDLETFNWALLGKHGWQFVIQLESLCSSILKTKYFPNSSLLHATIPSGLRQHGEQLWQGDMYYHLVS